MAFSFGNAGQSPFAAAQQLQGPNVQSQTGPDLEDIQTEVCRYPHRLKSIDANELCRDLDFCPSPGNLSFSYYRLLGPRMNYLRQRHHS